MIKLLLLFLALSTTVNAAPPSRQTTYTTLTTIRSADVTGNEDVIFNYLQGGVDTFADNSIVNADINSSAAISYAKLNLANGIVNADVSSSAAIGYSKLSLSDSIVSGDIAAGTIVNSDISASAAIVGSKLDLSSPGAIGGTTAAAGTFSTLKVGTTNQGDILYDNGTSLVRLTPGTSGQFLKTQGASANPTWATESAFTVREAASAFDKTLTDFTIDGSPHDMDLSSIIPSTAKTALLTVRLKNNTAGVLMNIQRDSSSGFSQGYMYTQVSNVFVAYDVIVNCTAGVIRYFITNSGTWANVDLVVKGYWS